MWPALASWLRVQGGACGNGTLPDLGQSGFRVPAGAQRATKAAQWQLVQKGKCIPIVATHIHWSVLDRAPDRSAVLALPDASALPALWFNPEDLIDDADHTAEQEGCRSPAS
jgi:hypothetical protein